MLTAVGHILHHTADCIDQGGQGVDAAAMNTPPAEIALIAGAPLSC